METPGDSGQRDRRVFAAGSATLVVAAVVVVAFLHMSVGPEWSRWLAVLVAAVVAGVAAWMGIALMAQRRAMAERSAAMASLEATEARLQGILDNTEAVIYAKDLEGRYLLINRRYEKLFGTTQEQHRGRTDHALFPKEVADAFTANDRFVLERGPMQFEEVAPHADGPHTYVSTKFPVCDAKGRPVAVCGISTDITDRKRAEIELQRAKDAAEAATQAKSEFLANMSHEIRTPLNAVIGMTALILDTRLDAEQREYAETIHQSGEALLTVINDILDFSRIESGKLRLEESEFPLAQLVEESLDIVAPQAAGKGLDLGYHVEPGVPAAWFGDAGRVRQVLLNLLSNAVKFTERGEVSVWVASAPQPDGRHELTFSVKDTGIGIAPDRRDRLFQSFSQLDPSTTRRFGGSGLGLAISKALVELMGGRIWAVSEPGRGSEFRFTIAARPAPEREPGSSEVFVGRLFGKRVLVVDDSPANRRIVELQASSWGMKPRIAASAAEALEWLRAGEPFDVALLDAHMPGIGGVALADEIRSLRPAENLPIIMVASLGRRPDADVASRARLSGFLTKPVKPLQLMRSLADALMPGRPPSDQGLPRAEPLPSLADARLRILVAEDNPVNQRVLVRMLAKLGFRADVAATGLEVLSAIERGPYDLVLMDVQMPDMDGLAAAREIVRRLPRETRPSVVAMTANARPEDEAACIDAGMDGFVAKPVRIEALESVLAGLAPRSPSLPQPLDRGAFERLRSLEHDAPGVMREIVDLYLSDAPARLASMREAAGRGDAGSLASFAHGLKGSSGYIGAREMEAQCAEIERLVKDGRPEAATAKAASLDACLDRVRDALLRASNQAV